MKINIIGRKIDVRPGLKEHIEDKLAKLDKYFKDDAVSYVTLSHSKNSERLELTVTSSGTLFRAEEEGETFQSALDVAIDTIVRQIRKNKTRLSRRLREGAIRDFEDTQMVEEDETMIRRKTFALKPMSAEEAILQMNLLGHTFYMFLNEETGKTAVVYKRNNGGYGLIEPEK